MSLLGKLSWSAIPIHQPIIMDTVACVAAVILAALAWVTAKGYWPYLWREWLTSVDHKRIGVMYLVLAMVMLVRSFSDGIMMRTQQAVAE
jgi:cytochrome o ubiquinol oxidase subunit 1